MKLLYRNSYDIHPLKALFWIMAFWGFLHFSTVWGNMLYEEGYEITVQGRVETHKLSYSVGYWWKYPYTKITLRTLSDESCTLELYGHYNFDVNSIYRITYTRISPLGQHVWLIGEVLSIEQLS